MQRANHRQNAVSLYIFLLYSSLLVRLKVERIFCREGYARLLHFIAD